MICGYITWLLLQLTLSTVFLALLVVERLVLNRTVFLVPCPADVHLHVLVRCAILVVDPRVGFLQQVTRDPFLFFL